MLMETYFIFISSVCFQYSGVWYEITKIFFVPLVGETCIQANYSVKSDGHIKVVNTGIK